MSLFKKLPFDAEVDIREKALNHCRAMFVKDLDLQQVIEFMAPDDNCFQDNLGVGQSTKEEQIVRFLNYLNTRNEKSFSLFMDFLNENHKHLFTLMEETIRSLSNCQGIHGNQDEMRMTGERLQHLLKKREKNPIHKAPTDQLVGSEDSKINPSELDECYISCHSMTARGRQDKDKLVTHVADVEKDKDLSMSVVISDSVFRKISLPDANVPDLVRRPPKQCEVYVYDDEQGRNAEKKAADFTAAHRTKHDNAVSSCNFINNQHNEMKKYTRSCGTVQVPPPVPPKPSHLPLTGFDVGMSFAQKTSGSEVKVSAGNLKKREIVKDSSSVLSTHTVSPTASVPFSKKTEKLPYALKKTGAESLTLTGYRGLPDGETGMPQGNALETVQRQSQESDLMTNEECSLDYNVSLDSASDLGFEEKNVGEDKKKIWKTDEASESFSAAVENRATPTYSSVDLERKNSRFRGGTSGGKIQSPRIEVFVNDVDETAGNRVDEVAKVPEKSPVYLLPDETFPAPETVELRSDMVTETDHHLKPVCDMADPPLPAKQISLCELPDDEDDTSSDNSYYEDIDVLSSQTASRATNGELYLDPKMKERTSGKWRGLNLSDYRSNAPPYKIIPKGYLFLVENVSSCQELSHTKSGQSTDDDSHTSPIESFIKISLSDDTSASQSNRDEETETARETTSKPCPVISQRPDILCETSATNSQDVLHYFYNTRLAYDKDGHAFYVPIHLLKKFGDPDGEPWFYPLSMTARQAALFLMAEKLEGCFVVYQPLSHQSPDVIHNLSVCLESGDVVHYHIIENTLGDIRIEGHDHSFMTLTELIDYFSKNKSSLATRLRRPLKYARLPITPGFHYDINYELERTELSLTGNIIGRGYFGVVCSGTYRNLPVAIKVLQQTDGMLSNEDDFLEEAKSLMGLRHEHIVRLIGVSCKARPFFIVTEFASNGSVKDCLRNGKLRSDHVEELFKLCVQMASAMSYLEAKRFMLHRDLASRNFLMANKSCVKLADFGRARLVRDDCYQAPRKERICIKWASPEVLIHSRYSSKSDVWAAGVVFWELFSWGERPYASLPGEQTAVYVVEGGRLDKPSECPPDLYQTMRNCWKEDPQRRPTFAQLHEQLKVKSGAHYEHSFQLRRPNSLAVGGVNQLVTTPSSSKPTTPSSAKFRLTYPAAKKFDKFTLPRETSDDRRNSLEPKLLVYRNRAGTSSSETSIASGNGFLDLERGEEDLSRGDRIRRSLRNLMKIKTKGRPGGTRLDIPGAKRCQDTL